MTLVFMDGYDDGLFVMKGSGTVLSGTNPPAAPTAVAFGRTGVNCLRQNAGTASTGIAKTTRGLRASEEHATVTVGVAWRPSLLGVFNTASIGLVALLSDSAATSHVCVSTTSGGALELRRGLAGGTLLASSSAGVVVANEWHYVELQALLSDTVGTATLRLNGVTVAWFSGDTKNAGTKTVFDSFGFGSPLNGNGTADYDDLYVCNGAGSVNNTFLGDCKVETLLPNGNGATSAWVGSDGNSTDNYLLVGEEPPSMTDFVQSATVGATDTYAHTNLATGTGTVAGVQVAVYAKTDAGAANVAPVARSGANEAPGTTAALSTTVSAPHSVFETKPVDGGTWTIADVNAGEFGVKVV